ncbi:MAG: hypothetical protein FWG50_05650 [Kiritimatiellaeota bacterium]|nr:hypothetical protein [Kiritimatiellota bacterium]
MKCENQWVRRLLATGVLLTVAGGALAQDAVQYQWVVEGEGSPVLRAVNTVTGQTAEWDGGKWVSVMRFKLPDWDNMLPQRPLPPGLVRSLDPEKGREARDAFLKAVPQMPLEALVEKARCISVFQYEGKIAEFSNFDCNGVCLKSARQYFAGSSLPNAHVNLKQKGIEVKVGDVLVQFEVNLDIGGVVTFYLSSAVPANEKALIFPAPETVADDVRDIVMRLAKEEEKRQKEQEAARTAILENVKMFKRQPAEAAEGDAENH